MNKDFKWFMDHYQEFQKTYGDAFLAIKNEEILGVYNDCGSAVRETQKTEQLGTFIVQECKRNEYCQCCIASMNFA